MSTPEKTAADSQYDFTTIEAKWQKKWADDKLYLTPENPQDKFYLLVMFAYPSGDIHMGHFRNYIIGDAIVRYQMMQGKDVLHPFGWDAFGLPAEQAAIKRNLHPNDWTVKNIKISRETLQKVGISFDWDREVVTCQPDYYIWTQWLFLKLYEKGLAYRKKSAVNFCEGCNSVLANEQVMADGSCWRDHPNVGKKKLEQWYLRITDFAQRLLDSLDDLPDWPDRVKSMQRYWIGRSEGCEITFKLENSDIEIPIFTTRPDTIYGVTFMAVAPDAELLEHFDIPEDKKQEVDAYIKKALKKTEIERQAETDDKEGVFTGLYAINPLNNEKVQIWIGDYVLASYGTGVVMAVPAHDQRDFLLARKYNIPIKVVIKAEGSQEASPVEMTEAYTEYGEMCNSDHFNGLVGKKAISAVNKYVEEKNIGKGKVNFKLRDWLISRQRFWGTPIPIIHCPKCGEVAVPENDLPIELPLDVKEFIPKGRSPLEDVESYINIDCPKCGEPAKRDPDTMDTFMCSAWYMLRYADNKNSDNIFDSDKANSWLPIDTYIGGIDHATGHLLYFRFITKVCHDLGLIDFDEPAKRLFNHGMVNDEHGKKMSKSVGNVAEPMPLIKIHGVDVCRLAVHFSAPADKEILWSENSITGVERFVHKFYRFVTEISKLGGKRDTNTKYNLSTLDSKQKEIYIRLNQTIKKYSADIERMQFNTCLAGIMELFGNIGNINDTSNDFTRYLATRMVQLLAPLTPHLSEECWQLLGHKDSVFKSKWPEYDPEATEFDNITVALQVNGKVRGQIDIPRSMPEDDVKKLAVEHERVKLYTADKDVKKVIYVKEKLVSIVVK